MTSIRILFVCLGNICRSPTAEGVMRHLVKAQNLDWQIDSAGTGGWHIGDAPDVRMAQAAALRGIDLSGQKARQVQAQDFHLFTHIYAMDRQNLADLEAARPDKASAHLQLFLREKDVPDPYYGGAEGFEHVLDLVEARAKELLAECKRSVRSARLVGGRGICDKV